MPTAYDDLLIAICHDDTAKVWQLLASEIDLNAPFDDGATILFGAVLQGNVDIVRLLLIQGADPNFEAGEPACDTYAPKPLELALQARFLVDWETFHPIVTLLQEHGATDSDGKQESRQQFEVCRARALDPSTGSQRREKRSLAESKRTDIGNVITLWLIVAGITLYFVWQAVINWLRASGDSL